MSNPFGGEEKQGQDRESDLKTLGVEFFLGYRLLTPLRGGAVAQAADFPDYIQIYDGSQECEEHHGDSNGVLVKAVGGRVNSRGGSESAEADGDAHATNGDDGGAGALKNGESNAGPSEKLGVDERHLRRGRRAVGRSEFRGIL
ncbi:MAG TPA: hypothetical protein VIW93_02045 [Candidatus Acidoferrum sp.]